MKNLGIVYTLRILRIPLIAAFGIGLTACVEQSVPEATSGSASADPEPVHNGALAVDPTSIEPGPSPVTIGDTVGNGGACTQINRHSDNVIANVKIQNVFWGSYWNNAGATMRQNVNAAWQTIGNNRAFYSPFWQYNVGVGRYLGAQTNNTDPPAQVYDSNVQDMLRQSMAFGLVPVNDANMLYVVYLPPGTTSHPDVEKGWGGHHDVFPSSLNSGYVYYATITGMTTLDNLTLIGSHEVDEAMADPNPRYAAGWDEVGDPCQTLSPRGYRFNSYLLERVYSNFDCGCVSTVSLPFPSKHDLAWWNSSTGFLSLWQMNGTASVRTFATLGAMGLNWRLAGLGDFDGDGEGDVLWYDTTTGNLNTWLIHGVNVQKSNGTPWIATVPGSVVAGVGDFDNDGISDVLWRNPSTGGVRIAYGGARNDSSLSPVFNVTTDWTIQGIGDFNFDRRSDILWRNTYSGDVAVWLMNGSNPPQTPLVGSGVGPVWQIAGVGDFDGDGKSDILWRNTSSGDVGEWLMNGGSVTGYPLVWSGVGSDWQIQTAGDIDGDGKADIVWRQTSTGNVGIWRMNGASVLSMDAPKTGVPSQWLINGTSADQTY